MADIKNNFDLEEFKKYLNITDVKKKELDAGKIYYWKKVISIKHKTANALNKLMTEFYIEDSDYIKLTPKEGEKVMIKNRNYL